MSIDRPDIDGLLQRARQGDAAALAELFSGHDALVRRTVALRLDRRLLARLDVSDVAQDTYLEATRRLEEYLRAPALPFHLWLRWLAREKVLALHRQHLFADRRAIGREAPPLPLDASTCLTHALLGREPSPSQAAAAAEVERLRQALGRLDDDERDLILWRHFEHLANREIAQLLGIAEEAAAKRYIRAVERLRCILVDLGVSGVR